MDESTVDLSWGGASDLLLDPKALAAWETLRRLGRPASAQQLADLTGFADAVLLLDRLAGAGLVIRLHARGQRRTTMYRANGSSIRVEFAAEHAEAASALQQQMHAARSSAAARDRRDAELADGSNSFAVAIQSRLRTEDLPELRRRIAQVTDFLRIVAERRVVDPGPGCFDSNHVITIELHATAGTVPPQPFVRFVQRRQPGAGTTEGDPSAAPAVSHRGLSPRERQVARAMLSGMSREETAKHLGLSPHTVATNCKRLYRKLGIQRRSQLPHWLAD